MSAELSGVVSQCRATYPALDDKKAGQRPTSSAPVELALTHWQRLLSLSAPAVLAGRQPQHGRKGAATVSSGLRLQLMKDVATAAAAAEAQMQSLDGFESSAADGLKQQHGAMRPRSFLGGIVALASRLHRAAVSNAISDAAENVSEHADNGSDDEAAGSDGDGDGDGDGSNFGSSIVGSGPHAEVKSLRAALRAVAQFDYLNTGAPTLTTPALQHKDARLAQEDGHVPAASTQSARQAAYARLILPVDDSALSKGASLLAAIWCPERPAAEFPELAAQHAALAAALGAAVWHSTCDSYNGAANKAGPGVDVATDAAVKRAQCVFTVAAVAPALPPVSLDAHDPVPTRLLDVGAPFVAAPPQTGVAPPMRAGAWLSSFAAARMPCHATAAAAVLFTVTHWNKTSAVDSDAFAPVSLGATVPLTLAGLTSALIAVTDAAALAEAGSVPRPATAASTDFISCADPRNPLALLNATAHLTRLSDDISLDCDTVQLQCATAWLALTVARASSRPASSLGAVMASVNMLMAAATAAEEGNETVAAAFTSIGLTHAALAQFVKHTISPMMYVKTLFLLGFHFAFPTVSTDNGSSPRLNEVIVSRPDVSPFWGWRASVPAPHDATATAKHVASLQTHTAGVTARSVAAAAATEAAQAAAVAAASAGEKDVRKVQAAAAQAAAAAAEVAIAHIHPPSLWQIGDSTQASSSAHSPPPALRQRLAAAHSRVTFALPITAQAMCAAVPGASSRSSDTVSPAVLPAAMVTARLLIAAATSLLRGSGRCQHDFPSLLSCDDAAIAADLAGTQDKTVPLPDTITSWHRALYAHAGQQRPGAGKPSHSPGLPPPHAMPSSAPPFLSARTHFSVADDCQRALGHCTACVAMHAVTAVPEVVSEMLTTIDDTKVAANKTPREALDFAAVYCVRTCLQPSKFLVGDIDVRFLSLNVTSLYVSFPLDSVVSDPVSLSASSTCCERATCINSLRTQLRNSLRDVFSDESAYRRSSTISNSIKKTTTSTNEDFVALLTNAAQDTVNKIISNSMGALIRLFASGSDLSLSCSSSAAAASVTNHNLVHFAKLLSDSLLGLPTTSDPKTVASALMTDTEQPATDNDAYAQGWSRLAGLSHIPGVTDTLRLALSADLPALSASQQSPHPDSAAAQGPLVLHPSDVLWRAVEAAGIVAHNEASLLACDPYANSPASSAAGRRKTRRAAAAQPAGADAPVRRLNIPGTRLKSAPAAVVDGAAVSMSVASQAAVALADIALHAASAVRADASGADSDDDDANRSEADYENDHDHTASEADTNSNWRDARDVDDDDHDDDDDDDDDEKKEDEYDENHDDQPGPLEAMPNGMGTSEAKRGVSRHTVTTNASPLSRSVTATSNVSEQDDVVSPGLRRRKLASGGWARGGQLQGDQVVSSGDDAANGAQAAMDDTEAHLPSVSPQATAVEADAASTSDRHAQKLHRDTVTNNDNDGDDDDGEVGDGAIDDETTLGDDFYSDVSADDE